MREKDIFFYSVLHLRAEHVLCYISGTTNLVSFKKQAFSAHMQNLEFGMPNSASISDDI